MLSLSVKINKRDIIVVNGLIGIFEEIEPLVGTISEPFRFATFYEAEIYLSKRRYC